MALDAAGNPPAAMKGDQLGGRCGHDEQVQDDLAGSQWAGVQRGELIAPDGKRYARRTTRAKRRDCESLIAAGLPLVLFWYGGQQLEWFDGDDASSRWLEVRGSVVHGKPSRRGEVEWNAGLWVSNESDQLLLLTGTC